MTLVKNLMIRPERHVLVRGRVHGGNIGHTKLVARLARVLLVLRLRKLVAMFSLFTRKSSTRNAIDQGGIYGL